MNYIRKALTTLGGVFLVALLIAALAPKATHGLVAALVQVANTTSTPVPNSDIKDQHPYQQSIEFTQGAAHCYTYACTITFNAVPAGYRLVVTSASAQYGLTSPGTVASVALYPASSGFPPNFNHFLPAPVNIGANTRLASGPITLYVEAGDAPVMSMVGEDVVDDGSLTAFATIVGYLVPVS